jgi:hypothetical protein
MRLLFSSPFVGLIEDMGRQLSQSGIPYEIRYRPARARTASSSGYRELWVQTDRELQWAAVLWALNREGESN